MSFEPGTRLGPYEVLAPIGPAEEERYKASDTRANRVVALKVLPSGVVSHPEVRARLDRDTRTISSLKHPQICAAVDVGHEDPATDFVVTEYVEGETLAQRLARSPIDLPEALTIGRSIADALDKAHRKGVTHGGLNPSVVVLTPDGLKVLDFGLARLHGEAVAAAPATMVATRTSLGSLSSLPAFAVAYTAPEQFEGREADARSDIFAVGAILYEMATGRPAFQEKTLALLVAAIQSVDPEPVSSVAPTAPHALGYLVKRCLSKDPRQRLQTARDLVSELQWVAESSTSIGVPAPAVAASRRTRDRAVWAGAAVASVLALALVPSLVSRFEAAPVPEPVRFVAASLPTAIATPLALSPDGRWLVTSPGGLGASGVVALSLDAVTTKTLVGTNNITQPFWSPDSRSIAFYEDNKLKRADVAGGPAQIICDATGPFSVGTWNREGVILFPNDRRINRVLAAGGQPAPITTLDEARQEIEHVSPVFLPDGRHFLFLAVSSQPKESAIFIGSLDSSERTLLFNAESRTVYAAPGYLLFSRGDTVFAHAFDADTRTLSGEDVRIASGVANLGAGLNTSASHSRWAAFSVSQSGVMAYRAGGSGVAAAPTDEQRSLFWFDRTGTLSMPLGPTGTYAGIDLSPDGRRFAVHRHEGAGGDNWFFDLSQGRMQRLTFDATQHNSSPVWSPDGSRIAFASLRKGQWGLYVKAVDGAAQEELITESDQVKSPTSWSPDGKFLVYTQGVNPGFDVLAVPVAGDRKPFALADGTFPEGFGVVSPDGRWLAYSSGETGRAEVYVKPFPTGSGKWQISTDGGQWPRWRGDGKELYFIFAANVIAADIVATGSAVEPGVPHVLFNVNQPSAGLGHGPYNRFAVTADGRRFLISQPAGGTGLVAAGGLSEAIIANADRIGAAPGTRPNTVSVVLNWQQLLTAK